MSEGVAIAIITALSAVLVALIGAVIAPLMLSIRKHAKTAATQATEANVQVSNDHSLNLRVEGDIRHEENRMAIADVRRLVISGQRANAKRFRQLENRLGFVEHTIPTTARRRK